MYDHLRRLNMVSGTASYPDELLQWIREKYPDEDQETMGKYDNQTKNQRPKGTLEEFLNLDWGICLCK